MMHACMLSCFSRVCSLRHCGLWPGRLPYPGDSPGKNSGVGYHALLLGIFLTQGLNPHLFSTSLAGGFFTTSASWEAQRKSELLSHVWFFATLWTIASKAPLSMGFSKQEYWSDLPCSSPGDLPDPGIELASLMSSAFGGRFFTTSTTRETLLDAWEYTKMN